jgi:hypothetical protein
VAKRVDSQEIISGDAGMLDIYMIESDALLVARPKGVLNAAMTERIVELIEIKEIAFETGFNRFCDLSRLKGINLLTADILKLADRRRTFNPNYIHVKSAFLAIDTLAFGVARMYEQLLNSPRIELSVFSDLQAAAEWLAVRPDCLRL